MGNKCKRFLVLLIMAVLLTSAFSVQALATEPETITEPGCYTYGDVNGDGLVDRNDAIYLLYHFYDSETYPLNGRAGEMDGTDGITANDAIHLLYHTFPAFAQRYALPESGRVHSYSATWNWSEKETESGKVMEAKLTLTCECGDTVPHTADVTADATESVAASCTEAGKNVYIANIGDYTARYEEVIPATGHSAEAVCTGVQTCSYCNSEIAAKAHTWGEPVTVEPTCETAGSTTYTCTVEGCGATKGTTTAATGHTYGMEIEQLVEGTTCQYVKVKSCTVVDCTHSVTSEAYDKHEFTVLSTYTPATCSAEGKKVYFCAHENCTETKTETVAVDSSVHTWDEGTDVDGGKLYTCTGCQETKTVVTVTEEAVKKTDIEGKELTLDEETGTSIALDSAASEALNAEKDIQISVTSTTDSSLSDNTVYDFTMEYKNEDGTTEPITNFEGSVTVRLPYDLADGEDVECILVRYIPDEESGEEEYIQATYADGYITFTTNHFSYYTVTRLTPAQRCEKYGHKYGESEKTVAPTCTEAGYTMQICQRCLYINKYNEVAATGHNLTEAEDHKAPTCEATGKHHKTCSVDGCEYTEEYDIPAIGHAYNLDSKQDASCEAAGNQVYKCNHDGCESSYEVTLPALNHSYGAFEGGEKQPTCTEKGHVKHQCEHCQAQKLIEEIPATGHSLKVGNPTWTYDEDGNLVEVTVGIDCDDENCTAHWDLSAVITEEDNTTCEGGTITYVARGEYKGMPFEFRSEPVPQEGAGHKLDHDGDEQDDWFKDNAKHYRKCTVCKEVIDSAPHTWDEGTVTKAATCAEDGEKVYKCACGQEKTETVPATGLHNIENGVCVDCGFVANDCKHYIMWNNPVQVTIDLTEYGACPGTITLYTCECGENQSVGSWTVECNLSDPVLEEKYSETYHAGYIVYTQTCTECDLTYESYAFQGVDNECNYGYGGSERWYKGETEIYAQEFFNIWEQHSVWAEQNTEEKIPVEGLCEGATLIKMSCLCGENSRYYMDTDPCQWELIENTESSDGYCELWRCAVCGAERENETIWTGSVNCMDGWTSKYTCYDADGNVVYTYTNKNEWEMHDYQLTDYILYGDSCKDGIEFTYECADCDATYSYYDYDWHYYKDADSLDLSGYDICYDTLQKQVCFCGQVRGDYLTEGSAGDWCSWNLKEDNGDRRTYECLNCGAVRVEVRTEGQRDADCNLKGTSTHTVYEADGDYVVTYYRDSVQTSHEYVESFALVDGATSCEDGVKITRVCTHCGHSESNVEYYHAGMVKETLSGSKLGMCGDVTVYGCACGEIQWIDTECSWSWVDGGSNWYENRCDNCGIYIKAEYVDTPLEEACHYRRAYTDTYYNDSGAELVTNYETTVERHDAVWVMELLDGATSCEDGYTLKYVCQNCGYEEDYGTEYYHSNRVVSRTLVSQGQLCGDLYQEESRCACGQYSSIYMGWKNGNCNFEDCWDEEGNWYYQCADCGAVRDQVSRTVTPQEDSCKVIWSDKYAFVRDGQELCTVTTTWSEWWHNWDYTFTYYDEAQGCDGGYDYTATCSGCGTTISSTGYYGCHGHNRGYELIHNGEGICGAVYSYSYSCPCGAWADSWVNHSCNFNTWAGTDETTGQSIWECEDCGLQRLSYWEYGDPDENCNAAYSNVQVFWLNGEEVGRYSRTGAEKRHNYTVTFTLQGETCADGFDVTYICLRCGDSYTNSYAAGEAGCWAFGLGKQLICDKDEANICGDIYVEEYSCACGENTGYWRDHDCNFTDRWDENNDWYAQCDNCGLIWDRESTDSDVNENCDYTETYRQWYTLDGEEVGSYQRKTTHKSHNYGATFNLQGETCADGFDVTYICLRCGDSYTESYAAGEYDCSVFGLGKQLICNEDDICGDIYVEEYSCACGENTGCWWYYDCNFTDHWDENGDWYAQCDTCGLILDSEYTYSDVDDNCDYTEIDRRWYTLNGEEVGSYQRKTTHKSHNYGATFNLLGETCDDGYTVTNVCKRCGDENPDEEVYYGHDEHRVSYYDLADYGLCGGWMGVDSCACGEIVYMNWGQYCDYYYTGNYDENGAQERYCSGCDTYVYVLSDTEFDRKNCRVAGEESFTVVRNGETLLTEARDVSWENHTHLIKDYVLDEGAVDCDGGYSARYECFYCGDGYDFWSSGHDTRMVSYVDLSEVDSACGGYLRQYSCACGKYHSYSYDLDCDWEWSGEWTEVDVDGIKHTYDKAYCEDCKLYIFEDSYFVPDSEDSCNGMYYRSRTFHFGDDFEAVTLLDAWGSTEHNYGESVYALAEGAVDCNDGIVETRTCQRCGDTTTSHFTSNHYRKNRMEDSIDLTQYGSVCGQTLDHYVCPCGANEQWSLSEGDCDLDQKLTAHWIEGIASYDGYDPESGELYISQETADGYHDYWSYAYTFTCAVTDPQACGLKIRMAEYWLQDAENCQITEYQTWQLGYDETTGECAYEFTVATGESHSFHSYEDSHSYGDQDDGTYVEVYLYDCETCGSYYTHTYTYQDGDHIKSEYEYVNALDNGETKRRYNLYEYGYERAYNFEGSTGTNRFMTLNKWGYTYADGSEYWGQYAYTYDEDACQRTYVYTNSNGESWQGTEEAHYEWWRYEVKEEATCTQFGSRDEWYICAFCQEKTWEYTDDIEPTAHNWEWDDSKATYVCCDCGLENINGASGVVVMEDLTDTYGKDENYVIGYWNRENVAFSQYVSVIFEDLEEDNEFVLDVTVTDCTKESDGFVGKSFSKADALAAAADKVAQQNYSGAYAIRISFVPENDATNLDYAITFDPVNVSVDSNNMAA